MSRSKQSVHSLNKFKFNTFNFKPASQNKPHFNVCVKKPPCSNVIPNSSLDNLNNFQLINRPEKILFIPAILNQSNISNQQQFSEDSELNSWGNTPREKKD